MEPNSGYVFILTYILLSESIINVFVYYDIISLEWSQQ